MYTLFLTITLPNILEKCQYFILVVLCMSVRCVCTSLFLFQFAYAYNIWFHYFNMVCKVFNRKVSPNSRTFFHHAFITVHRSEIFIKRGSLLCSSWHDSWLFMCNGMQYNMQKFLDDISAIKNTWKVVQCS